MERLSSIAEEPARESCFPHSAKKINKRKRGITAADGRPASQSVSQPVSPTDRKAGRQEVGPHQLGWHLRQLANVDGAQKDGAKSKLAFRLGGGRNKEIMINKKSQPASLSTAVFVFLRH